MPNLHALVRRMDALRLELNEVLRDPAADAAAAARAEPFCASAATESRLLAPSVVSSATGWHASRAIQVQLACFQGENARYVMSVRQGIAQGTY